MRKEEFDISVFSKRFLELLEASTENTYTIAKKLGLTPSTISRYTKGLMAPKLPTLYAIADIFEVNPVWLFGFDVPKHSNNNSFGRKYFAPSITEDTYTFPVVGEIAAGYDSIALEEWEGDTIEVPASYLKGRKASEFFVLRVKGDSMYPMYQENDKVLILKQSTLNYSGQVGAILYDDEYTTLKKVEFVNGENWMRLIPINPSHPPKTIEGADLERCKVIGIPKLLIREIEG